MATSSSGSAIRIPETVGSYLQDIVAKFLSLTMISPSQLKPYVWSLLQNSRLYGHRCVLEPELRGLHRAKQIHLESSMLWYFTCVTVPGFRRRPPPFM